MAKRETYLDWNATAPLRPEAIAAAMAVLQDCGNPSSVHRRGRRARQMVERARASVAALVGAGADDVTFTSGGTEANHLALHGAGRDRVLVSAVEHSSVLQAVPDAELIPVGRDGRVDLDRLDATLAADAPPALVSVMLANNETGVLQPMGDVARIAHAHGALLHCDAVQAAGKLSVNTQQLGADLLTVSAHKLGGPPGIGALIARTDLNVAPVLRGGGQERGRRAGTENLPGIAAFGAAAEAAFEALADHTRVRILRERLEEAALAAVPAAAIIGADAPRLPNTIALALPGVPAETQVIGLDLEGVMVSAGAACSSGKVGPSHVLAAMGLPPHISGSTIRVSLGWSTTEDDISHFLDAWTVLARRLFGRAKAKAA